MSDPYPDLDPWEAYEVACKRIVELEAEKERLREALETMLEMIETKGFGKQYAIDMARDALLAQEDDR